MGKLMNGILGGFSGTVGPVVGASWRGKQVIRSRPPSKRRHSSKKQLKQQAKMSLITSFIGPLSSLLNSVYQNVSGQTTCFNKAMSYNLRNAIDGEYPAFKINYTRVVLGIGDLLNVDNLTSHSESAGRFTISWRDNSNEGSARATDQLFLAVYCVDLKQWNSKHGGPQRNAGICTIDVPAFSGKSVEAYIGFLSADARFVTTSLYTGSSYIL
jgi:hypothetical protein